MLLTIQVALLLFLQASSLPDTGLSLTGLLADRPHLEELYGSGEFRYNNNQVDSHYAYSFDSLLSLFKIERKFVGELDSLYKTLQKTIEAEDWKSQLIVSDLADSSPLVADSEFLTGPPVSLYRLQSLHNISPSDLAGGRLGSLSLPSSPHHLNCHSQ